MEIRVVITILVLSLVALNNADFARPGRRFAIGNRVAKKIESRDFCPESYSPCSCESTIYGLEIKCVDVTVDQIVDLFFRTKALGIYSLDLSVTTALGVTSVDIPPDFLSDKRVQNLYLRCPVTEPKLTLTIDQSAFRFTRSNTSHFEIDNCDLSTLASFNFLQDFNALREFVVLNSAGVNLQSLPELLSLLELTLTDSTGLEENAASFPILTPARVAKISFNRCGLSDNGISAILTKIGASTAAGSLAYIDLSDNQLSVVPAEIHSFAKLGDLIVTNNLITSTQVGDLGFYSSVYSVYLDNNRITEMAANTFEYGDFTKAAIHLEGNGLSVFSEKVFLNILRQMSVQPPEFGGFVDVLGNPFLCNCDLAWLIRDNPDLINYVRNGKCGGFFNFEDLTAASFNECPPS